MGKLIDENGKNGKETADNKFVEEPEEIKRTSIRSSIRNFFSRKKDQPSLEKEDSTETPEENSDDMKENDENKNEGSITDEKGMNDEKATEKKTKRLVSPRNIKLPNMLSKKKETISVDDNMESENKSAYIDDSM